MPNVTWACFRCRQAVRRPAASRVRVRCPACQEPCRCVGWNRRLPPKRQAKAWDDLLAELQLAGIAWAEAQQQERLRRGRELRDEIKRLEALSSNPGRDRLLRDLRRQLAAL